MKTMKVLFIGLTMLTGLVSKSLAQEPDFGSDKAKCEECISLYSDYLKQKNYPVASKYWSCVFSTCPKYKESIYINGAIIYRNLIDAEKDAARKKGLTDTLFIIYDNQMNYFTRKKETLEKYGLDILRYRTEDVAKANKLFKEAIDTYGDKVSSVTVMYYYQSLHLMAQKKIEGVTDDKMADEYFKCKELLEKIKVVNAADKNMAKAEEDLDKIGMSYLPCEKIEAYATRKFNELPKDNAEARLKELKSVLSAMERKNCTSADVYDKIVAEVVAAAPSPEGYYSLGNSLINKKKYSEANDAYKKAIELCNGCEKQGEYLLGMAEANLRTGNKSTAFSYAKQAIAKDPKVAGRAYLVCAQAVAGSCGDTEFDRKFTYILAYEYCVKAKNADPSVASDANSMMGRYRANWPSKEEKFDRGFSAKTFTIGCWIGETVTVPADK
jgi:tetratricopeptide (TPR) repeat protein